MVAPYLLKAARYLTHKDTKTGKLNLLFLCLLRLCAFELPNSVNQERVVVSGFDTDGAEIELLATEENLNKRRAFELTLDQRL